MKRSFYFAILFLLCGAWLSPKTEFSGYFENRFFLIENPVLSWRNFSEKIKLGDYNRLRLDLKASPSKTVTVNIAVDIFSFHGTLTSPLGTYDPGQGADQKAYRIDPDRIYVDLYFKHFDLSIGKQRVALGVSYVWAPLDVFNRVNILEPREEKPGANAFKLYVPFAAFSSLTCVFSPDDEFKTSKSALRVQSRVANIDAAFTLIRRGDTGTSVYGFDLRGENGIGWWLEYGYFVSLQRRDSKLVLGFDYTFPVNKGLYWLNEFFYDAGGERDSAQYDFQKLLSGDRFTLGTTYFLSLLRYGLNDFWSASLSYIGNWGDGSFVVNPLLAFEVSQNVSLSSGLYIPLGPREGEFNASKRNLFFIWLKVNF